MEDPGIKLPKRFYLGTASAAYQIEGATTQDGRGPSIWDQYVKEPGTIDNGDTGDSACDHYNRWREDVEIMADLGLNAYRFSIGWSRVIPRGRGEVNKKGLDFYSQLIDALLEYKITPFVTLNHFDPLKNTQTLSPMNLGTGSSIGPRSTSPGSWRGRDTTRERMPPVSSWEWTLHCLPATTSTSATGKRSR
jgi:beta-glucosidase/6-phospho-beta-glucosidase/beta-galactosidase